tara:strand:- start:13014 stop:15734 length:2721 start_codon:yes stop_codon:yes gene_type:complete
MTSAVARLPILALSLLLTACGGGGSSAPADTPPPQTPPPVGPGPAPRDPQDAFACGSGGALTTAEDTPGSYVLFESAAVRPLALSDDGKRLLVTNTPANCLEIYSVGEQGFSLESSVMVGIDPVAVAFANPGEAWVINHISDSVSIVDLTGTPSVRQTLQVGDEPGDIVFAGENNSRAFITAAYRGQNHPTFAPDDLTTPGLGRADVWVYDARQLDTSLTGGPLAIINLFADTPRALAVTQDGTTVYAAAFMSGNTTTTLSQDVVAGAKPSPTVNREGAQQPDTGLIVKKKGTAWVDDAGADWSNQVLLDLPDLDVFAIDAMAEQPAVVRQISGVGTTLFNMAVNPISGELYISNLEALNHIRFEGPGEATSTVRGHIAESRITVVTGDTVSPVHLNDHIAFDVPEGTSYPPEEVQRSLSQPTSLVVSPDGEWLYVAAYGSQKVVAIPTAQLHDDNYQPNPALHVETPAGGPAGMVLSPDGNRMVVYTRFDNAISLWDPNNGTMLAHQALFSPEPDAVIDGRRFLYDARESSANGTSACSSCHIFGDLDQLAWDLGNPDAAMQNNPNDYVANSPRTTIQFHPMKGPMTTQTLRGIADSGPQHWRGDRTGQSRATVGGKLESVEAAAFKEFSPAFVGLVGRASEFLEPDMQAFTDFAMAITPPPNPIRRLDNSLTPAQAQGENIYFNAPNTTGLGGCNDCHTLDPVQQQFGTSGLMAFEGDGISENFKVPHLRNAYAKVGMFGTTGRLGNRRPSGDQIKGFGYLHDGSVATLSDFFESPTFTFPAPRRQNLEDVVRFVLAADSNMAPVVGQQLTLSAATTQASLARLDLLEQRAVISSPRPECDLIARGLLSGIRYSALLQADGSYLDTDNLRRSSEALRGAAQTPGNAVTFTCAPPGSGQRLAFDK